MSIWKYKEKTFQSKGPRVCMVLLLFFFLVIDYRINWHLFTCKPLWLLFGPPRHKKERLRTSFNTIHYIDLNSIGIIICLLPFFKARCGSPFGSCLFFSTKEDLDRHPERRMKAAYAAFEEANMARLKMENPNMRLSQLKQQLKKEWTKSPENPLNQRVAAYNSK